MKILRNPGNSEQAKYMNKRKRENLARSKNNKAENWLLDKLLETGMKWTRQARWGYRIFDFWCHAIGVAIEVDGPEHKKAVDLYRDRYNFHRSGIIVLRVQNFSEQDAARALEKIKEAGDWKQRRKDMGLIRGGKSLARRKWKEAGCFSDLNADLFGSTSHGL